MTCEKARNLYKKLRGVVCLYKPPEVSAKYLTRCFGEKVCSDLNNLEINVPINYLDIEKSESGKFLVNIRPSYFDNVLACGPKYSHDNVFLKLSVIGKRSSGVCLIGVNNGIAILNKWTFNNPLKVFHISGMLGQATQYLYKDEKVVARAKYDRIYKGTIDKVVSSFEAAHQRKIFSDLKIDMHSQEAYEVAVNGMLRLPAGGIPCIYSIKCIHFKSPHFILEISCLNENENYFLQLIHDLGLQLRTFAHCTGIRCIRFGPFTTGDALITSQLSISNILQNIKRCKELSKQYHMNAYPPYLRSSSGSVAREQAAVR